MTDINLIKVFAQTAGLGGLVLVFVLIIFRNIIQKDIFASLTKQQSYKLFRMIIVFTSLLAITGMGAWVYVSQDPPKPTTVRVVLSGTVKGSDGVPIRGVNITVDRYPFRAVSNTDGSFAETLLLPQLNEPVTLRAFHKSYLTNETSLIVAKDDEKVIILMEKRQ